MRLLIVRHGETEYNAKGIVQGHIDSPLTSTGNAQVAALAAVLERENIAAVYSSDLGRATTTAEVIAKPRALTVEVSELLRERHFGALDGSATHLLPIIMQQLRVPSHEFTPAGGESLEDVRIRARRFLDRFIALDSPDTVLIVGHGGINRGLIAELLDLSTRSMAALRQENTCINTIQTNGVQIESVRINDVAHIASFL